MSVSVIALVYYLIRHAFIRVIFMPPPQSKDAHFIQLRGFTSRVMAILISSTRFMYVDFIIIFIFDGIFDALICLMPEDDAPIYRDCRFIAAGSIAAMLSFI